jgi:hypothetical protein
MAGQKIRIRLKAYDHEVIDTSARKIVDTVTRTGASVPTSIVTDILRARACDGLHTRPRGSENHRQVNSGGTASARPGKSGLCARRPGPSMGPLVVR